MSNTGKSVDSENNSLIILFAAFYMLFLTIYYSIFEFNY